MKTLKRLVLLPLFCGLLFTTACTEQYENGNDTDNGYYNDNGYDNGGDIPFNRTITAVIENGNNYDDLINKVAITLWSDDRDHTIATGTWSNGAFTITLPETINAEFLSSFFDISLPQDFYISDASARWMGDGVIRAYDEQQRQIGILSNRSVDNAFWSGLVYVDRDITARGTLPSSFYDNDGGVASYQIWNFQHRAGWNRVYFTEKREGRIDLYVSSEPISGLLWFFDYWGQ